MTIEEAAATLGLSPAEATPEAVERNYREKVKRCHPDRADYPGATSDFKRATLAFETLRGHNAGHAMGDAALDALENAAEEFRFVVSLHDDDIFTSMKWWERARSLWHVQVCPIDLDLVPKSIPLVVRSVGRGVGRVLTPLVVAPVDTHIVSAERRGHEFVMTLRPIETDRVGEHLQSLVAEGMSLPSACQRLADQLTAAALAPLRCARGAEGRAA